ncbi:MAG: hypothetical protein LBF84_04205 [Holosporales bacterium]|nr:hypothetical protein [Holosporales bacterium]
MYKIFPKFLFACATFVCTLTHGCSAAGQPVYMIVDPAVIALLKGNASQVVAPVTLAKRAAALTTSILTKTALIAGGVVGSVLFINIITLMDVTTHLSCKYANAFVPLAET